MRIYKVVRQGRTESILSSIQRTTRKKESLVMMTWWTHLVDTPVPIPNTEVKHHSGYGIARESGKSPGSFFYVYLPI